MPQIGVQGKGRQGVMQPARVCEHGDPSEKGIAHEKSQEHMPDSFPADPGIDKENVHGNAAELKGEIPPVVLSAAKLKGQCQLLPDLASQHEKSAQEEKPVCACRKVSVP